MSVHTNPFSVKRIYEIVIFQAVQKRNLEAAVKLMEDYEEIMPQILPKQTRDTLSKTSKPEDKK